jgi:hypothetical protein
MAELQKIWVSTDILWHADPLLGNGRNRHAHDNRRAVGRHIRVVHADAIQQGLLEESLES